MTAQEDDSTPTMSGHCLQCSAQIGLWDSEEFAPCCSDDCLALAVESGAYDPLGGRKQPSHIGRVDALLEKQLAYMESHQRGPAPFVPSGDTKALRDLVATLLDMHKLADLRDGEVLL